MPAVSQTTPSVKCSTTSSLRHAAAASSEGPNPSVPSTSGSTATNPCSSETSRATSSA